MLFSNNKGQAAIEYLMNYAWAIALIIIVGIAIFGLNIGGVRNSLTAQSDQVTQSGEQLAVIGHTCNSLGNVSIALENRGAVLLKSIGVGVANESNTVATGCTGSTDLFPGRTVTCSTAATVTLRCGNTGNPYEIQVNISYVDDQNKLTFKPKRNFTGIVQAS